jgi:hypothetical protein
LFSEVEEEGMRNCARPILIAWLIAALIDLPGCAPDRSQWMSQAANQQAKVGTDQIGSVAEVKTEARQASELLKGLTAAALKNPPAGNQQVASAFSSDAMEVSAGLQAIAESQTDPAFTNAVFAMCDPTREAACPRVGHVMMGIAAGMRNNPPANMTDEQRLSAINYFETFGGRLIDIPTKCEQASAAMTQASGQEQQAEAEHQTNVNRTLAAAAVLFTGAVVFTSAVGAAAATRPPVTEQTFYNNQFYR